MNWKADVQSLQERDLITLSIWRWNNKSASQCGVIDQRIPAAVWNERTCNAGPSTERLVPFSERSDWYFGASSAFAMIVWHQCTPRKCLVMAIAGIGLAGPMLVVVLSSRTLDFSSSEFKRRDGYVYFSSQRTARNIKKGQKWVL